MISYPVLCFHKIDPQHEVGITNYRPQLLRQLLEMLLASGFQFCWPEEVTGHARPIVLTFDDAYANIYHYALPILADLRLPFIVFVISDFVGQSNSWDVRFTGRSFRHMNMAELEAVVRAGGRLGNHSRRHKFLPVAEALADYAQAWRWLREHFSQQQHYLAPPFGRFHAESLHGISPDYIFLLNNRPAQSGQQIVSRYTVYAYEGPERVFAKIAGHRLWGFTARMAQQASGATILWQKMWR
jgi:peptidoglycan/xylan/chitin deacetylase (PgdA/CDA1 family)